MSSISSRSRVHSIDGTSVALACGAVLLGALMKSLSPPRGSAGTKLSQRKLRGAHGVKNEIKPLAVVRERCAKSAANSIGQACPTIETVKTSTFRKLSEAPYFVQDSARVREAITALQGATRLDTASRASETLIHLVETEHQAVFTEAIRTACVNASVKTGFKFVKIVEHQRGISRVIADDGLGQALVTEISANSESGPNIQTEVVGVMDGSCDTILSQFDNALDNEGVKASIPRHKYTGGVCELAAAKEFLMSNFDIRTDSSVQDQTPTDQQAGEVTRTQKLNRANVQRQMRK